MKRDTLMVHSESDKILISELISILRAVSQKTNFESVQILLDDPSIRKRILHHRANLQRALEEFHQELCIRR